MSQEEWQRYAAYPHYTLADWAEMVHQTAKDKGWWEGTPERTVGDQIALMHSELSEALEEYRNGRSVPDVYFVVDKDGHQKPEGVAVELIDCIIRILDTLARYGVNPQHVMALKAEYNLTRKYRHGGKTL